LIASSRNSDPTSNNAKCSELIAINRNKDFRIELRSNPELFTPNHPATDKRHQQPNRSTPKPNNRRSGNHRRGVTGNTHELLNMGVNEVGSQVFQSFPLSKFILLVFHDQPTLICCVERIIGLG
jgi:hypothetical protein